MESKKARGFASLSPERLQEITSMGGKAVQLTGRAHKYTSEEASIAGRKGGAIISSNREHMSKIGKLGAEARKRNALSLKNQI